MSSVHVEEFTKLNNIITRALPKAIGGFDIKEIIRHAEADEERLSAALQTAFVSLIGQSEPPQPEVAPEATVLTVEVFHEFELDGEAYDAVEVKWTGETPPTLEEAIKATDTDGSVVRSEAEWQRVHEHRQKLPEKLDGRWVVTARPLPDDPRGVSCLGRDGSGWYGSWSCLDLLWYDDFLVLRRRT